jgi:acyl-ACP thioesterase
MYSFDSRVRYSEVNSERQLTLSALLDYLQDCCTFESEELKIGVDYLAKEHRAWVLSSWQIKIQRYPVFGEQIKVSTWPYHFKGFYGHRNFTIQDQMGNVIVKANSVWVFMDTDKMRPIKIDDAMLEAYRNDMREKLDGDWGDRKITFQVETDAAQMVSGETVQVARYHIDTNHHMNNGKYVQIAETFLPDAFTVKGLRVEYRKAALLGDIMDPSVMREENRCIVVLAGEDDRPYAVIEFE